MIYSWLSLFFVIDTMKWTINYLYRRWLCKYGKLKSIFEKAKRFTNEVKNDSTEIAKKFRLHLVFCVIEFLNGSRIIYLPFEYFRKITLAACLGKARRDRDSLFLLIRSNTQAPWITICAIQTNGNHHHILIRIPILDHILVHSVDRIHAQLTH